MPSSFPLLPARDVTAENSSSEWSSLSGAEQLLDMLWPALEQKIGAIPKPTGPAKQNRPQHEILEELVTSVRGLDVRLRDVPEEFRYESRRRRPHPEMIFDLTRRVGDKNLSLLIAASYFRDTAPWVYELAMEAYRAS